MWLAHIKTWLAIAGAVIVATAVAVLWGYTRGREHAVSKIKLAKQKLADAQATVHAQEVRNHVDEQVAQTPDAPPQKLADADPHTAAGELREHGWLRDGKSR